MPTRSASSAGSRRRMDVSRFRLFRSTAIHASLFLLNPTIVPHRSIHSMRTHTFSLTYSCHRPPLLILSLPLSLPASLLPIRAARSLVPPRSFMFAGIFPPLHLRHSDTPLPSNTYSSCSFAASTSSFSSLPATARAHALQSPPTPRPTSLICLCFIFWILQLN
ncbi:hypothetical protein C8J57DRAFT_1519634 [Mycena rebaudengoi]|nr:hypothetical protein C8J57DRAFT_1519634 [Mycena rebaudengoi]